MQSDVMKHFGLTRGLPRAGYFETNAQRRVFEDIKTAIGGGQLLALVGLVGCGKTTTLYRLAETLKAEKDILVSQSLAVDKHRINLASPFPMRLLTAPARRRRNSAATTSGGSSTGIWGANRKCVSISRPS